MHKITDFVLRRPVTTLLVLISLVFFGIISVFNQKIELTPEMNMPMMIISTTYAGASPEDVDELITKPIEKSAASLSDVKKISSQSMENYGVTMVQYNYGTNMDKAYSDLKKKMDSISSSLPDDADDPTYIEMDMNSSASLYMAVENEKQDDLYNYVSEEIVPEFEKLSSVASVSVSGGQEQYVRVQLKPEMLKKYNMSLSTVASMVSAADFSVPAGTVYVGQSEYSVSTVDEYDTVSSLKDIAITTGNGNTIYLKDIADVSLSLEDKETIGRYNGKDTIIMSFTKVQKSTAVTMSRDVLSEVASLEKENENLHFHIINDSSDDITDTLKSVFETMIMAIIVSMLIIYLFFGEWKASLIVGTSIPISILTALVAMYAMGYTLNLVTMSALVLGVGMMVDNSIVVLEACFRALDHQKGPDRTARKAAALEAIETVGSSVMGSTVTTCVVFLPMAALSGMSGQLFAPLGFTIVFCMIASLISAVSVVPLCFVFYKPKENTQAPAYRAIRLMQDRYREIEKKLLKKKALVMITSIVLLIGSLFLARMIKMQLMPSTDEGTITVTAEMKPGLKISEVDKRLSGIEEMISQDTDVESYTVSAGSSGLQAMINGSDPVITAYLKDDRSMKTKDKASLWRKALSGKTDMVISVEASDSMSSMNEVKDNYQTLIQGTNYQKVKEASDRIVEALRKENTITAVHSSIENAAPFIKLKADPVLCAAEGLTPAAIGGQLYSILSGSNARTMQVNDQDIDVIVEYPKDEYDDIQKVEDILLTTPSGQSVRLGDLCKVSFADSPASIIRTDRKYYVTISADYTEYADQNTRMELEKKVSEFLTNGVERATSSQQEYMNEEFKALGFAILTAVFLIWVVMAAQFESMRFSFMVMTTIPFALIGSFSLLWLADSMISMTSLLGFLMLVGTAVNNGILYVDTVNQYRKQMHLNKALIEAGAIRLRPILMTTLTTVIAMVPMAVGYGNNGETMQGLAIVDVGGLVASTILSLLMLPIYYYLMDKKKKEVPSPGYMEGNDPEKYYEDRKRKEEELKDREDEMSGKESHDFTDGFPD